MFRYFLILCFLLQVSCAATREKQVFLFSNFPPPVNWIEEAVQDTSFRIEIAEMSRALSRHVIQYKPYIPSPLWSKKTHKVLFWNPSHYIEPALEKKRKSRFVAYLWEPPTVLSRMYDPSFLDAFGAVYTWDDDLVDNIRFFKFYYPELKPMTEAIVPFDQKKLCTMIISNKQSNHPKELYSTRRSIIEFFEKHRSADFHLFGYGWPNTLATYRGTTPDKIETARKFRFAFAIENMKDVNGYITEKIFDVFAAGAVPIYLGANNISSYIPNGCFISLSDFNSYEELYQFLVTMDENRYNEYLNQIQKFLESDAAQLFSVKHFQAIFKKSLR